MTSVEDVRSLVRDDDERTVGIRRALFLCGDVHLARLTCVVDSARANEQATKRADIFLRGYVLAFVPVSGWRAKHLGESTNLHAQRRVPPRSCFVPQMCPWRVHGPSKRAHHGFDLVPLEVDCASRAVFEQPREVSVSVLADETTRA